jgi:ribosomal-protein-alanine N-acetyltransferase
MADFTITRFSLRQMNALLRLERAAFARDAYSAAEFTWLWMRGRNTFLVAQRDTEPIGYIAAFLEGDTGYIASIAVHPAQQGKGVGRALMETARARLVAAGARRLALHVRIDNAPAIHLYQSLGFTTLSTIPDYYPGGESALYMEAEVEA